MFRIELSNIQRRIATVKKSKKLVFAGKLRSPFPPPKLPNETDDEDEPGEYPDDDDEDD